MEESIFENRIDELIACNSMTKANHLSKEQDAMEQKLIDVMNLNRHVYRKHEKW